jgi:transposase-like protein
MDAEPKTLQQAIIYFSDPDNCVNYLVSRRWPSGVICPNCLSKEVSYLESRRVWQCKKRHPKAQFSVKVGTVMEDSAIGLEKWLPVMWMIANCKNGVSSHEISRSLGVTQKSAWFMLHRVRLAMKPNLYGDIGKLGGPEGGTVEVDESFIGGKIANMHKGRAKKVMENSEPLEKDEYGVRYGNKTVVMGMFDRESRQVRAKVIPNVKRETLQNEIMKNVRYGSNVYTDSAVSYNRVGWRYVHETVNHAESYVNGQVHTNPLENFWSLLKRNLTGTYHAIEPFHLDRYLDEQLFRFNNRVNQNDAQRFSRVVAQIVGRRLTYAELTGADDKKREAEAF